MKKFFCIQQIIIIIPVLFINMSLNSADINTLKNLLNSSYHKNLFEQTYRTCINRVEWDGYARTALESSYPDMYIRDAANQVMAHIGKGDLDYARDILGYIIRYCRAINIDYAPHHIGKVDRENTSWPYGNPTNRSVYSQPDHPDTLWQINGTRYKAAQRFTPALNGHLQGVEIYLDIEYKSEGIIYLSIQTDLQGTNILGTSQVSVSKIGRSPLTTPAGNGWVRFEFLPTINLTAGTQYYIVVNAPYVVPKLNWLGKKGASGVSWGPSYTYDSNNGGWSSGNTTDIFAFVVDDMEGKYRVYPNPSTAQEADANYIFVKAWADYIFKSNDTKFRDYTYDVVAKFANYYLSPTYYNTTFNLIRNPWLECPKVHSSNVYDMFTNAYAAQALKEMRDIAIVKGDTTNANKWDQYYLLISSGINKSLAGNSKYNGKPVYYELISGDEGNKLYEGFSSWSLGPIPAEWDKVDPTRLRNMYELFKTTGSFWWRGTGADTGHDFLELCHVSPQSDPVQGEGVTVMVRTEAWAWELEYNTRIQDYDRVVDLLNFMQYYNRDPNNPNSMDIIPEAMGYERYLSNNTWAWNRGNQIMAANYVMEICRIKNIIYPPVSITCVSEPRTLVADGSGVSTITAYIKNELGEQVTNSTATVTFAISGPGILIGSNPVVCYGGKAVTKMKSTTTPGTINITATSPGLNSGSCSITTFIGSTPTKLVLSVNPSTLRADGKSTSILSAAIKDSNNNTINTATNTVTFNVSGPGALLGNNIIDPINGIATAELISSIVPGTITVSVSATGLTGDNKNIITIPWGALRFNGSSDYTNIPASPSLNFTGNQITIEAWIRNLSPGDWNSRSIVVKHNGVGLWSYGWPEYHFNLTINGENHDLQININNQPQTEWTHLAGTYDGNTIRFFYNGTIYRSKTVSGTITSTNDTWHIGGNPSRNSYFWGDIDEVRISNICRYTENFIVPQQPFNPDNNTVGLWHMDETSSKIIYDASNNNNNGTINNPSRVIGCSFPLPQSSRQPIKLLVTSNNNTLPANGISSCGITATVVDEQDNIVTDSTATITFTKTGSGTLVGSNPVIATGGIATITYKSGLSTGTVTITATSQGLNQGTVNIILVSSSGINNPPNTPTNLKCNNQTNPKDVTISTPTLSWIFTDPDNGDNQSAYRILVANNLSVLNSNTGNMWDTNKTNSFTNFAVYSGSPLLSNVTYYWKVMVWDNHDTSSEYSQVATFTMAQAILQPFLSISTTTLVFRELEHGQALTLTFDITNTGSGTLTGTITTDQEWITVDPPSFVIPAQSGIQTINVTVDNSVLNQTEGQYTGTITIESNGGTATVNVIVTATCVLVKPNPYNPNKGLLTFFGDGIVPGQTTIKIYTLSGELVKKLTSKIGKELIWDGKTESGDSVVSGIYLYTYESPKEKGINKFTLTR